MQSQLRSQLRIPNSGRPTPAVPLLNEHDFSGPADLRDAAIPPVRDDGSMAQQARSGDATETDQLVQQAIDELYSIEPEEFMARRAELVAAAKAAKDREATKRITALRKPTRSAFAINRMVRREPEALDGLLELGDELRAGGAVGGRAAGPRALEAAPHG